jgi:ATP-binding cassette subfamily B protein
MKEIWKFLYPILKPYKWHYFVMFQIPMVAVAFNVLNSYAIKLIVDAGVGGEAGSRWSVAFPIAIFIGIATLQEVVCRSGQRAFNKSQPFIRGKIISKAYEYVQNHSYTFFQNTQSGSIASKIKGIVDGYNNIFDYIWFKITNPLMMCIFGTLSLGFISSNLLILVFGWCVVFFLVLFKMTSKLTAFSKSSHDARHVAIGMIADNIGNIFTIFSFTAKQREFTKISNFTCGEMADLDYQKNFYSFKFNCTAACLFVAMTSTVLIFTSYLRYINQITVGDFTYVITLLYKIIYGIWSVAEQTGNFFDKLGDFKSSFSILQIPQNCLDKKDAKQLII